MSDETRPLAWPVPADEAERLADLRALDLLDTPSEGAYDAMVEIAAALTDAPIAALSLVDAERHWLKACVGSEMREVGRESSFCAHAIVAASPLVVEDIRADPRFADNPFVTGDPGVRFYAGVPLTTYGGRRVGTLCVLDFEPRRLERKTLRLLERLARLAVDAMETRRAHTRLHRELSGWNQ